MNILVKDRKDSGERAETTGGAARPIVLGTLACRVDPAAERMAIESAIHAGSQLLVTNVVHLRNYPTTLMLVGPGAATLPHEERLEEVRGTAERSAAMGIPTEHLRVSSKRPVKALLEVAHERGAGLIVFGPDPREIGRRVFLRAARRIRDDADCLVWITPDG